MSERMEPRSMLVDREEIKGLVDRLIVVLERHAKLHRGLLVILERKKSAMVAVRPEDLEAVLVEERAALDTIADSERDRVGLTEEVGAAFGFPEPRRMRLLDLVQRVGEDHRDSLLDLRDELRELADAIDRLNRLNGTLVLHSLEHIHLFLSLLSGKDPAAKIYSKAGGEEAVAGSIIVDRRI